MRVRTTFAGLVSATLAASALSLAVAGPAHAAGDPDDATFTPVAGDLIGVGSDTSQHAVHVLAEGAGSWGAQTPAPAFRIASFAATPPGTTIALPSGTIPRPNGSGAGKALLFGASNNTDIDFARSSSAQSATETAAGLQSFPFALDTLAMAVSNNVPSNAPASLTPAQIVGIYSGSITDWSAVGGTAGTIAPKIPQAGSGTRSFFTAQLQAMNGGVAVTLAGTVAEVQEHDDTLIKGDANAIAPFSVGRAGLLGTTLRLEQGWKADRALYNVVRGADLGRADIQSVFGSDGFFCSVAARSLIEQSGFKQLAPPARGGVCGAATQAATTNFTLNQAVATQTALSGTSDKANAATLVAKVTASTAPAGTVTFYNGTAVLAAGVPLVSGQATKAVSGLAPGSHAYRAVFTPASGSQFEGSEATGNVFVKTSSKLKETFADSVKLSDVKAKGKVKVKLVGVSAAPKGKVTLFLGKKKVGAAKIANGAAKFTLKIEKLTVGKNKLKAEWGGDANAVGAKLKFTVKRKK
jgi:ABC-type phosphate transport system substrate-binding protein